MKLKDVDIVPDGYWDYWEMRAVNSYIAALPTVEAIPIVWIDSYITDCNIGLANNDILEMVQQWRIEHDNQKRPI